MKQLLTNTQNNFAANGEQKKLFFVWLLGTNPADCMQSKKVNTSMLKAFGQCR